MGFIRGSVVMAMLPMAVFANNIEQVGVKSFDMYSRKAEVTRGGQTWLLTMRDACPQLAGYVYRDVVVAYKGNMFASVGSKLIMPYESGDARSCEIMWGNPVY